MSEQSENGGGLNATGETVRYVEKPKIITNQLKNYVANQVQKDNIGLDTLVQQLEINKKYTEKDNLINDIRNTTKIMGGSYAIIKLATLISLIYKDQEICINIKTADADTHELKHRNSYHYTNGQFEEYNKKSSDNIDTNCELTIGLLYGKINSQENNHYDLLFVTHEQNKLPQNFIKQEGDDQYNYYKFSIYGDGDCLYTAIAAHLIYISGLTKEQAIKLALYSRPISEDGIPTPAPAPAPAPPKQSLPLQLSPDMSTKLKDVLSNETYFEEKIYEEIPEEDINNTKLDKLCTYDLIKDLLFQKFNVLSSAVSV